MKQSFSAFIKAGACLLALLTFISVARGGFLYVVHHQQNAPATRIYGFRVSETSREMILLPGFPIPFADSVNNDIYSISEAITIDRKNRRLYALNTGSRKIGAFSINPVTGALTPMPFSPISLTDGLVYNTIAVHPSGSPLIAVGHLNNNPPQLLSFAITPTTATPTAGNPYPNAPVPFSSVFSRDGNFLYTGGDTQNAFFAYAVNATTGALSQLPGSPYNSSGSPTGLVVDGQGRLFMSKYYVPELRAFTITAEGVPVPVSGNPFASGLEHAVDAALHPNEQFYYVADRSDRIGVYRINGTGAATTLSPVTGSPFPARGEFTVSLVFNQAGNFLYVANGISRNIATFEVNTETGFLTFNNVQPINTLGNGILTGIAYLSPAISTVSGRVTDSTGRPVSRALITATDEAGNAYTALTNPFGYYRFDELLIGATYTFTVRQKQFVFAPQNYVINENTNELNFIAQP